MQNGTDAQWSPTSRVWIDVAIAVVLGSAFTKMTQLMFGQTSSAPVPIILALLYGRSARKYEQARREEDDTKARRQMEIAHAQEVQRLKIVLNEQQADHLAVIRKMKLEQNQVLLKCHELELSLRG